jgi:hypothetical protein
VDETTARAIGADEFFVHAAELLKVNAPHAQDYPMLDHLERIGFEASKSFGPDAAPVVSDALRKAVPVAQKRISDYQRKMDGNRNGLQMATEGIGTYDTDYLRRAQSSSGSGRTSRTTRSTRLRTSTPKGSGSPARAATSRTLKRTRSRPFSHSGR